MLNPKQFLYHGTNVELNPGDVIKPGEGGVAYAAGSKWYAIRQARKAAVRAGKGTPKVYKVKPVGETSEVRSPMLSEADKSHMTSTKGFEVIKTDLRDASVQNKSLEPVNKIIQQRTKRK
jgi:hypothetical protein